MADDDKAKPAETQENAKSSATGVLLEASRGFQTAAPPVRPYLLTVVVAVLLIVIMPSLPSSSTAKDRILVIFSIVCAAGVVQLFGLLYEVGSYRLAVLQQKPDERRHNQQAAAMFPKQVRNE